MKPEHYSSTIKPFASDFWSRPFCLLSSLGIASTVLTLGALPLKAQTEIDLEALTPAESVPDLAPVETSAEALLKPQVTTSPAVESPSPAVTPTFESAPATPPLASDPEPAPTTSTQAKPSENLSNTFIDPTDYSLGATPSPDRPAIVFSDRSTGCQFTLQQGQSAPANSCGTANANPGANGANAASGASNAAYSAATGGGSSFSVGPVTVGVNGVSVGNTTVISREYFNEKLRPLNLLRRGAEEFVFPLAMPSPITSLFGWRTHPIFGDRRFHSGTDLGAPEGTPVVATKDGEVHVADFLGGYGLTVILRHEDGSLETRYAHLSQILVRPGEQVKQGEVVGLVGSTGNSTGPHLHFELRELTAQGWILINPNELLQFAVVNLVDAINNPLQALGLEDAEKAKEDGEAEGIETFELPFKPAQPNAS